MITRTRLLAGLAGLAILASACGGTAQPAPTTAPTVAPTLAATLAPTVAPTPTKLVVAATGQGATVAKVTENKVALADGSAPYVPAGAYVSTVVLLTLEKGGRTPAHRHAGVEAIFVLEGTIDFRTAGGGRVILRAGQGSAVPPNTAVQAVNGGDGVAKILAFLMIQENAPFQTNTDEAP